MSRERLQELVWCLEDWLAQVEDAEVRDLRPTLADAVGRVEEYLDLAQEGHSPQALRIARVVAEGWWEVLESAGQCARGARQPFLAAA